MLESPRKFLLNTRWTIFVSRYPKKTYEDFVELIKVILMVCVALLDHVCIRRYNAICDLLRSESYGISLLITFTVLMSVHGDKTYSFALCCVWVYYYYHQQQHQHQHQHRDLRNVPTHCCKTVQVLRWKSVKLFCVCVDIVVIKRRDIASSIFGKIFGSARIKKINGFSLYTCVTNKFL